MADICIIAVGYNRPNSMNRLLNSLANSDYEEDNVDLLISIDKGEHQKEIIEISEKFKWSHGKKSIRAFVERQGLRSHIIKCGDISYEYSAVVILEDDITVSPYFYTYIKQCIIYYHKNTKVTGFSLYKHHVNVGTVDFFEPEFIGYDVYLMQFAQSWGQCWTSRMWDDFKKWYECNKETVFESEKAYPSRIPDNILRWGSHSWMKYFMAYIVEKDLYYVYPYHSLSTNHSEVGQHNMTSTANWQVSLVQGKFQYRLPSFADSVKYDIFFERINQKITGYEDKKTIIDLYGNKKCFENGDILISSALHPYKVLETRKLKYRPHEVNCCTYEKGEGLFIYDLHSTAKPQKTNTKLIRTRYDVRAINWRLLIKLGFSDLTGKIRAKLKFNDC